MSILHIYAQAYEHQDAFIVGDRVGLLALRDALTAALEDNLPSVASSFCADGEGYMVFVVPSNNEEIDTLYLPYKEWVGRDPVKVPYDLIGPERYRDLVKGA